MTTSASTVDRINQIKLGSAAAKHIGSVHRAKLFPGSDVARIAAQVNLGSSSTAMRLAALKIVAVNANKLSVVGKAHAAGYPSIVGAGVNRTIAMPSGFVAGAGVARLISQQQALKVGQTRLSLLGAGHRLALARTAEAVSTMSAKHRQLGAATAEVMQDAVDVIAEVIETHVAATENGDVPVFQRKELLELLGQIFLSYAAIWGFVYPQLGDRDRAILTSHLIALSVVGIALVALAMCEPDD